jgi:c-di-AMP phosphodiesterase-like protein
MNNEIIKKINNLPSELIILIKEYTPKHVFIFTNRENYKLYHYLIRIRPNQFDDFVRNIIKRDNEYTLNAIIRENYFKWYEKGQVYYKNMTFGNYLFYIINYSIENESENCLKIINIFLKELGLGKNLHKKNVVRYIKWKNSI